MTSSVVDYENLMTTSFSDANTSVVSSARPRWERKKMEAATAASKSQTSAQSGDDEGKTELRQPLGLHNGQQNPAASVGGDRFIPNRAAMDIERSAHSLQSMSIEEERTDSAEGENGAVSASCKSEYKSALSSSMLGMDEDSQSSSHRVLSFKDKAPAPKGDTVNNLKVLYSSSGSTSSKSGQGSKLVNRQIPSAPSRILDAPDLLDDYYLNLLSWGASNILAVALSQTVYLWNAGTGDIQELCTLDGAADAHISSVSWVQEGGAHLAVGTSAGSTQLWDVNQCKQLRSMDGHTERVGALSWNRHILSSGGRDSIVVNHDVRVARHNTATLSAHTQEVCGLAWSPDGMTLASGANDNTLCLWDAATSSTSTPRFRLTDHQAAVKALAWSPHERNLLATGGGTADRTIKFWNGQTGALLNSIDTGSQVCALQWNPYEKELLSSHGFARNQLCLWKYPTMAKIKELDGHTARVLHMACGPDGSTVVSAAADETLRFWDVFAPPGKVAGKRGPGGTSSQISKGKKLSKTMHIR
uniref:CDC20/Fizzy WD40 domain-containing protein n=1 Tax=Odontella aurita TaxID=265563 RepID=A0A7S4K372_9STRA|eukprot:CAMPEP_0113585216 /NCGR_PEP_ID=MMETSP0015_2-20120614/33558_1 /TAXON_ID=2838 /ORGANISM="Odontella" /LENGTH=529 /DNA_ID=CAMNT_0000490397 /DNA_START=88 /DNA_END=1677 /DNA_ORIENTATION=+ /assembly_acc=CAM_ASM_000160